MSMQIHNTKLPKYGKTIFSDKAGETLWYIHELANARQDFGDKILYSDDDFTLEWIEMLPELAREVVKALRQEGHVALADQLNACVSEAEGKWRQEVVRLEIW